MPIVVLEMREAEGCIQAFCIHLNQVIPSLKDYKCSQEGLEQVFYLLKLSFQIPNSNNRLRTYIMENCYKVNPMLLVILV